MAESRRLYIKVQSYERAPKSTKLYACLYFSIQYRDTEYFSSQIPTGTDTKAIEEMNDHIIFEITDELEWQTLKLTRWEDHLPIFTIELELSEIFARQFSKKRLETKPQYYLNMTLHMLNEYYLLLLDRKTNEIAHYYCIDKIVWKPDETIKSAAARYLMISCGKKQHLLPDTRTGSLILQLPDKILFEYYVGSECLYRSEILESQDFLRHFTMVSMKSSRYEPAKLEFYGRWGYNLSNRNELGFLADTWQLHLYDFYVVFEKDNQYPDTKMKIIYGGRVYDLAADTYNGKKMKFRKLITTLLKPYDYEILIKLEKNHIEYCNLRLFTDELHQCYTIKRKLTDSNNSKHIGSIRFRSEKDKSLSHPDNNRFWRDSLKKRPPCNYLLSIEQISYYVVNPDELSHWRDCRFRVTLGNNDLPIAYTICLEKGNSAELVQKHFEVQKTYQLQVREEGHIYPIFYMNNSYNSEDNVEGLAVVDIAELKLGPNFLESPLYKNQRLACYVNLMINKVPSLQICKPGYHPYILARLKKKTRNITVEVSAAYLTAYLLTYEYDCKTDIYCIVEISRMKKVLLLQKMPGKTLIYVQADGSDYLNFVVYETYNLRVKLTFLVTDLGSEEEIYGVVTFKCRFMDLINSENVNFSQSNIKNPYEVVVGTVSATIKMADNPVKSQQPQESARKVKAITERSIENQKSSGEGNRQPERYSSLDAQPLTVSGVIYATPLNKKKNNHSVKLPSLYVKANRYANEKSLKAIMSKVKEDPPHKEVDYPAMDDTIKRLEMYVQKNRKIFQHNKIPQRRNRSLMDAAPYRSVANIKYDLNDPNVDKKIEMLFPRRFNKMKKGDLQEQINQYEKRLVGLKSILSIINNDIKGVEPEMHQEDSPRNKMPLNAAEFEDNEFIAMDAPNGLKS